jgi:hypothetical protein
LVPRFDGGPYGPWDRVEGVLVAREPMERLRTLNGYLRYVVRSPSISGAATYDSAEPLHEGPVDQDQEIPFALRTPDDGYVGTTTTHAVPVDTNGRAWTGRHPWASRR